MSRGPGLAAVFALVLSLGVIAAPAWADVSPNTAPGFPAEQSFLVGDVDNVNLFNGGLTLNIPIGGSYPVNGGLSYSLKLIYNANPWEFFTVTFEDPSTGQMYTRTFAQPNSCSNAGLGWRISLGRFNPPCQGEDPPGPIYQDENGTDHTFFPTLHVGDSEDSLPAGVTDVQYTRDGSYLRLKVYGTGFREIEMPDGTVRKFDASDRLTEIRDPFSNWLRVSYATANQWRLTDSQGRAHTVYFRTDLGAYPTGGVVDRVELAAFDGTPAVYQLGYTVQAIGRACPHDDSSFGASVEVPLLTSVTLPDSSAYTASVDDYVTAIPSAAGGCTAHGGNLIGLSLPTKGRLAWTWQTYQFPSGSALKPRLQSSSGVATRAMWDPGAGAPLGTWTYQTGSVPSTPLTAKEHTTTVIDPLGHKTVHYFSVATDVSLTGWSRYDYSLPFTRYQTLNVAAGVELSLSRQVYNSAGTLLRSEYVLYERDPAPGSDPPRAYETNRRMVRSRTLYQDDPGIFSGVVSSGFDGLGHYRQEDTEGNFSSSNVRSQFANYNPARGTYTVNPGTNTGSGYSVLPASSPWVLETMTYASTTENGATAQTDFCYAAGSTTLVRRRVHRLNGASLGAQDLVTAYDLDGTGNAIREKSYGGDAQGGIGIGIGTGASDLCTMALPALPEYQVDHTYSSGVRAISQYVGTNFNILNQTIEPNTGLVSSSQDSAGLQTAYEFDDFGRLTWSKPQSGQGGWTQYVYTPAGSQSARVTVRRRDNGSKTAAIRTTEFLIFDWFGRISQEQRQLPDGISKRETLYDGAGNKASVSEATFGSSPNNKTVFNGYDPFGRPGTIQPPDGAAHAVTTTYQGVRQVSRAVKIATAAGSETDSTTTEVYDRHGRLLSVAEPSGAGGALVTTTYGYDVGNRLVSVSTLSQSRSFSFDRAGLLQSETHPEKGATGNGTVFYPRYDSRGHALKKTDGPNDLIFTYDSAERLTQVQETGSGPVLKQFTYASANGTNDWSLGKLRQATRYNYIVLGGVTNTVQVAETYTYGGRDGRVSKRDTAVTTNGAPRESFTQSFDYTHIGLANSVTYPVCTHQECTQAASAVFADVPVGHPDQREIEAIYPNVTSGCGANPLRYCPNDAVTRDQMAVFLLLGKEGQGYVPPACTTPIFADMPCSSPYAPWIQELYRRGITGGCGTNPLIYCPRNQVSNDQMAVFLVAMLGATPSCATAPFTDVSCGYWAAPWIAEAARRRITLGCGGGNFCPGALVTRAKMAGLIARAFDIPVKIDRLTSHTAQYTYAEGLLTGVAANGVTYGTLSYHPNLLLSQVAHGNGLAEVQGNDPNEMRRPASLSATGPYASWSSGAYAYDGAGNIKTIGTSTFTYDKVSRLLSANLFDGPTGGGNLKQQSYTFDTFGNLTAIAGTVGRNIPTSTATNRLNASGTVYDAAGNLTNWNGAAYVYDRFNQMVHMTSGAEDWIYAYTADDERLWSYDLPRNASRWTVRDLGGKVLREYQNDQGRWSVGTDYLYRDGALLAAETQTGRRHFHLDHLGTPRLVTKASGDRASYHVYYPFGEEATAFNQDAERMKFTGHERDLASPGGAGDDLDYMHARHCSPVMGRFLSVDPALESADPFKPQGWNRYGYVRGNPLVLVDPSGEVLRFFGSNTHLRQIERIANASLHGVKLVINRQGIAALAPTAASGTPTQEQAAMAAILSGAIDRPETINIKVGSGQSDVLGGQYVTGTIDMGDLIGFGSGPAVSSASILAHEIAEQTAKQVLHLPDSPAGFDFAHPFGVVAQNSVSGFDRGALDRRQSMLSSGTGTLVTPFTRGRQRITVTLQWANGNLVRVQRR